MKLMYSVRDLLTASRDYARRRWGGEPEIAVRDGPFRADGRPSGIDIDDPVLLEFEGVIIERDDDSDDCIFVMVRNEEGVEREFDVDRGMEEEYRLGRHIVVRFAEAGRLPKGDQIIEVYQIWLG